MSQLMTLVVDEVNATQILLSSPSFWSVGRGQLWAGCPLLQFAFCWEELPYPRLQSTSSDLSTLAFWALAPLPPWGTALKRHQLQSSQWVCGVQELYSISAQRLPILGPAVPIRLRVSFWGAFPNQAFVVRSPQRLFPGETGLTVCHHLIGSLFFFHDVP